MTASFFKPLIGGVLVAAMLAGCGGGGDGSSFFGTGTSSSTSPAGSSSAPPSGSSPNTTPAAPGSLTLTQQIEQLERKGGYPTLDRSDEIAGPDANKNGVRDDIEAWINTLNVTEPQRKALMQAAKALQNTLMLDYKNKEAMERSGYDLGASTNCGLIRFKPYATFSNFLGKIEAMTANTKERATRYIQYNAAASGSSETMPTGDTCEQ